MHQDRANILLKFIIQLWSRGESWFQAKTGWFREWVCSRTLWPRWLQHLTLPTMFDLSIATLIHLENAFARDQTNMKASLKVGFAQLLLPVLQIQEIISSAKTAQHFEKVQHKWLKHKTLVACLVGEWGGWTSCSATCGGGSKSRTRQG